MTNSGLYRGYSSFEFQRTKNFSITDIELVKLDLLNHIFTPRGSRVMMTMWGTAIPQLLFEPLDSEVLITLEDELRDVFDSDPRVELVTLNIQPAYDDHSITANAKLNYVELNVTGDFVLNLQFGT